MLKRTRLAAKCCTPRCQKAKAPGSNCCYACQKRRWRLKNRMKATFVALRDNAKRRGIFFDLTFEQFAEFCVETEYMTGKGKTKISFSVDRMDETKGYTSGNLQVLTLRQNSRKEALRRKAHLSYDWQTRTARVLKDDLIQQPDLPF